MPEFNYCAVGEHPFSIINRNIIEETVFHITDYMRDYKFTDDNVKSKFFLRDGNNYLRDSNNRIIPLLSNSNSAEGGFKFGKSYQYNDGFEIRWHGGDFNELWVKDMLMSNYNIFLFAQDVLSELKGKFSKLLSKKFDFKEHRSRQVNSILMFIYNQVYLTNDNIDFFRKEAEKCRVELIALSHKEMQLQPLIIKDMCEDQEELPRPQNAMTPEEKGELLLRYLASGSAVSDLRFDKANLGVTNDLNTHIGRELAWYGTVYGPQETEFWRSEIIKNWRDKGRVDFDSLPRPKRSPSLDGVRLDEANLAGVHLYNLSADHASFENATMIEAHLVLSSGKYVCFAGADMTRVNLTMCGDLERADFMQTKLCDAWLVGINVRRGLFPKADLSRIHAYGGANFTDAQFDHANLTDADLRQAHLVGATFRGANLTGINLFEANLCGATLTSTRGIPANLGGCQIDAKLARNSEWTSTILLRWVEAGAVVVDEENLEPTLRSALHRQREGLTLTFDNRLHRFDSAAFDLLIAEVLGPETNVTIEEQSNVSDRPGWIRINGDDPEHLVTVAEAFYDRVWAGDKKQAGLLPRGIALLVRRLDELRDLLACVDESVGILPDDCPVSIESNPTGPICMITPKTRFQRVAKGVDAEARNRHDPPDISTWSSFFYRDLYSAVSNLEGQRHYVQGDREEKLRSALYTFLQGRNYDISAEADHGGHTDILVRCSKFDLVWIGECKIHRKYKDLDEGLLQLHTRYASGRYPSVAFIIFCFNKDAASVMKTWKTRLAKTQLSGMINGPCDVPGYNLSFSTKHKHMGSGLEFETIHILVSLYWKPE